MGIGFILTRAEDAWWGDFSSHFQQACPESFKAMNLSIHIRWSASHYFPPTLYWDCSSDDSRIFFLSLYQEISIDKAFFLTSIPMGPLVPEFLFCDV